jgi:hypothetical protein
LALSFVVLLFYKALSRANREMISDAVLRSRR